MWEEEELKNKYGFVLSWSELPEDLKEQKIDEYIEYGLGDDATEEEIRAEQTNQGARESAANQIAHYFPLYF
jgi:hypothetical protein